MISSEPQNILLPNLVCLYSSMSQSVMQKKKLFVVFKVKVKVRAHDQNMTCYYIFWTADSSVTKLGPVTYHKPECLVKKMDCCIQGQGHSEGQNVNVYPDDIFQTAKHVVTKPGIVMQHHEQECHTKIGLVFSRSRSQQWLICSEYDNFYYIFLTVEPFVTKLCLECITLSQSVLWRKWIAVFHVKITVKFQNVSKM